MAVQCLTSEQKDDIYNMSKTTSQTQIARTYGVSRRTIQRVINEHRNPKKTTESKPTLKDIQHYSCIGDDYGYEDYEVEKPEQEKPEFCIIGNKQCITISTDDGETRMVDHQSPLFDDVMSIILERGIGQDALSDAWDKMDYAKHVETVTKNMVKVDTLAGTATYLAGTNNEIVFTGKLTERLCSLVETGNIESREFNSLINFAKLVANSPDRAIIDELYDFLLASDIKIDDDGNVICWKKVRGDYLDCYTGTIDNSVGATPSVPRLAVDADRERTCSNGLHVCSRAYLKSYGGEIGRAHV